MRNNFLKLFWSLHHEINSYGGEYDIWQPARHKRRDDARHRKDAEKLHEDDIRERNSDADSKVNTHTASCFPARQRGTDKRQDDDGRRRRQAFMLLDFVR